MLADKRREVGAPGGNGVWKLRRSAAIRVALAVLVAGGATAIGIAAVQGPLDVRTDVIGYPIFADFNPYSYYWTYYLIVGLFPIAALLIFLGLTRIGPRLGLAAPPPRGRLRPSPSSVPAEPSFDEPDLSLARPHLATAVRIAFVGAVLGLEVGIVTKHLWLSIALTTLGYCLAVGLVSALPGWGDGVGRRERLAAANAVGGSLSVAGLVLVSAHTEVLIASDGSTRHYPWFPVWLGVPLCAALAAWAVISLRRAGTPRAGAIEWRAVFLIAVPVALFLLVAHLFGDVGQINLFEEGQPLAATRLIGHGWLPWRDIVVTHGLLSDVFSTQLAFAVLGNSYWAVVAGWSLLSIPITVVGIYYAFVYLVGRNWPVLLAGTTIFLGTWLGSPDPRLALWPVVLLLLAAVVSRPRRLAAAALGFVVVAQAIVTPEAAGSVVAVTLPLVACEWYRRAPGSSLAKAFQRTIWYAVGGVGCFLAFAIYMAIRGALGDVVYVTRSLIGAHFLGGALPPVVAVENGVPRGELAFVALAPIAGVLISFAYAVARLRLRRPFLPADWPMAAVAIFVVIYYTEFLARMDLGHAYLPFQIALPLLLYIIYRAASPVESLIRGALSRWPGAWLPAHPVGLALLVTMIVLFWGPLHATVKGAPTAYRPAVSTPPLARVGYAAQFDGASFGDLRRIVNAYLGPGERLEDLTDEPALFYYLIRRDPSSRWFVPNGIVDTAGLQRDVIRELRRKPPKLIVFDDTDTAMLGLPAEDQVPAMVRMYLLSRWVLDHYRPLLASHGRVIYARRDVPPVSSLHLQLSQAPQTAGLPFLGQACSWGYAPSFLQGPAEPPAGASAVDAPTTLGEAQVILTGWAGDARAHTPAREVVATVNGRIVGRALPQIARPDVTAGGYPAGFLNSGFQLSIPAWAASSSRLRVLALGRGGAAADLAVLNVPARAGNIRLGHRTLRLDPRALIGHVDSEGPASRPIQIDLPAGSRWTDYRWLEIDAPRAGFVQAGFRISDMPDQSELGHVISFQTLKSSPHRYVIPVSSCAQWHGYGRRRLFVTSSPSQPVARLRLIR